MKMYLLLKIVIFQLVILIFGGLAVFHHLKSDFWGPHPNHRASSFRQCFFFSTYSSFGLHLCFYFFDLLVKLILMSTSNTVVLNVSALLEVFEDGICLCLLEITLSL